MKPQSCKVVMPTYKKYNNAKTVIDGKKFDSKKEAKRYQELQLLKCAGEVVDFFCQPEFIIMEGTRDKWTGEKIRAVKYIADFAVKYKDEDHWVVEDVKGGKDTQTDVFLLKKKMFKNKYPCLELRVI